jgi:RNA 2',3'-cyclic 3'-phosphodiesterase
MIRSFLAIEIPENRREVVAGYIKELRQIPSKVKWISREQSHLTLKFFGYLKEETIERISGALSTVIPKHPEFSLTLDRIGAFPSLFRPRVIWLGLGGEKGELEKLYQDIEQGLIPLGLPKEDRPFHPHVTLGRNKSNELNEPLYRFISDWTVKETAPFRVKEITLLRSDLKPTGAVYTRLKGFPLNNGKI